MDVRKIFEECSDREAAGASHLELLEKLLTITNPMSFEESPSNDEIQELIDEMGRVDAAIPALERFRTQIARLPHSKGTSKIFI